MRLNQKVYELYKLNPEGKKITNIDIRKSDNIMLVINGICTEVDIKLLFEKISMFDNVIKGYSILQNFGLAVDKDTHEGYLIDKKENRLSLHNVETDENIFFGNIRNPFVQMSDININEQTEERYTSILKRAYGQVIDEEIKETATALPITNERITNDTTDTADNADNIKEADIDNQNNQQLTIEQVEQDFKEDGWDIYKIDNMTLFTKQDENPILAKTENDMINELKFVSSDKRTDGTIIHKFKVDEENDINLSLTDGKITILEPTSAEHEVVETNT